MVLKYSIFFLKMGIFNTILTPLVKIWMTKLIYKSNHVCRTFTYQEKFHRIAYETRIGI